MNARTLTLLLSSRVAEVAHPPERGTMTFAEGLKPAEIAEILRLTAAVRRWPARG
jgi:hypothetical protein